MEQCATSSILKSVIASGATVKIQETVSTSFHEGTISESDCLGILFIPSDKEMDKSFILYSDIRKIMLPDNK